MMKKRQWVEITVYFDDNWVQTLRRKDYEEHGARGLELETVKAIIEFGKTLGHWLGEAED